MGRARVADLLMWVGVRDYSSVLSFTREASKLGICKRVAQVPVGVKLGRSYLFLAHDEASRVTCSVCGGRGVRKGKLRIGLIEKVGKEWQPVCKPHKDGAVEVTKAVKTAKEFRDLRDETLRKSSRKRKWRPLVGQDLCSGCRGRGDRPDGRIFGFCPIDRLELVFDCGSAAAEFKERREILGERERVPVTYVSGIDKEPERRSGVRRIGAYYLVTTGQEAVRRARELSGALGTGFGARGPLIVFPEAVTYPGKRFRSAKALTNKDRARILKAAKRAGERLERESRKRIKRKRAKKRAK